MSGDRHLQSIARSQFAMQTRRAQVLTDFHAGNIVIPDELLAAKTSPLTEQGRAFIAFGFPESGVAFLRMVVLNMLANGVNCRPIRQGQSRHCQEVRSPNSMSEGEMCVYSVNIAFGRREVVDVTLSDEMS
jgi:hypothetical protein